MGAGRGIALAALAISVFIFGLVTGLLVNTLQESRQEYVLGETADEALVPHDRIKPEQIHVYGDHVRIDIPGVQWATFTRTGSMVPTLGSTVHGLQTRPTSWDDLHIGDVVSKHKGGKIVTHRIIAIGEDELGKYAKTKGDGNPEEDEDRTRLQDIDRVLVGILY